MVFCVLTLVVITQAWDSYSGKHKYEEAPLGPKGDVIDTPEVAHAKIDHFEKVDEAIHRNLDAVHHDKQDEQHKVDDKHLYRTEGAYINIYKNYTYIFKF